MLATSEDINLAVDSRAHSEWFNYRGPVSGVISGRTAFVTIYTTLRASLLTYVTADGGARWSLLPWATPNRR